MEASVAVLSRTRILVQVLPTGPPGCGIGKSLALQPYRIRADNRTMATGPTDLLNGWLVPPRSHLRGARWSLVVSIGLGVFLFAPEAGTTDLSIRIPVFLLMCSLGLAILVLASELDPTR